jgi:polyvinyl alcohol dehydrogenase (cytochrome)
MTRSRRSIALIAALVAVGVVPVALPAAKSADPVGCAAPQHPGGDWPTFGHDLSNTRHQPQETVIGPTQAATLEPAWDQSGMSVTGTKGDFTGTPIVSGGCVFAGSNNGFVMALNADTGAKVWATKAPVGGGVNASVGLSDDTVFAALAAGGSPRLAAFDRVTGAFKWVTQLDKQPGSETYASPVVYDGVVFIGVSGGSAELGDEGDRYAFQGSFVLVDAKTGEILKKTWTVREPDADPTNPKDSFAGVTVWSTPAIDTATGFAYVGTGNPFRPEAEHANANSIIKVDLRRHLGDPTQPNPDFGKIVDNYKGQIDEYVPGYSGLPCFDIPGNPAPYYPQGIGQCGDLDLDFGASPNLFKDGSGNTLVGAGQKSGVYHVAKADTMDPVWSSIVGPPSAVGGIVGSTAFDGSNIFGPITVGGYLWSVQKADGLPRWLSPVADGAHWGNAVSSANGVIYTVDLKGFLNAYESRTGAPLLHRPMAVGATGTDPMISWGGVSIARNTVYVSTGTLNAVNGHIMAFRPNTSVPDPGPLPDPGPGPGGPGGASGQIVSGPVAQFYGYLTPAMVAKKGVPVTYRNADITTHDVVQDPRVDGVAGPDTNPWCGSFAPGKCPAFYTKLLGLGEEAVVQGTDQLTAGTVYSFYCSLHPGMKGKLAAAG